MISSATAILATALPLSLIITILLIALLYLRSSHKHDVLERVSSYELSLQNSSDKRAELEKKLATFPKAWVSDAPKLESATEEVQTSFMRLNYIVSNFIGHWISNDSELSPSRYESPERLNDLLCPAVPVYNFDRIDQDNRVFPNPHIYTPVEILISLMNGEHLAISYSLISWQPFF